MSENKVEIDELELFQDLKAEYPHIPSDVLAMRLNYAVQELAFKWHDEINKEDDRSKEQKIFDYYTNSDLYIFDLTKYQIMLELGKKIHQMLEQTDNIIENIEHPKILEYGGGIGNYSIRFKRDGEGGRKSRMVYYDLEGPTKDYAKKRIKKHAPEIEVANSHIDPLEEDMTWDVVNIMDCLEHMETPEVVIERLGKVARYIFVNPGEILYNNFFPQHISRFDVSKYFKKVDGYLWKNRNLE